MTNFDSLTTAQSLQAAQEYLAETPATHCTHDPKVEKHNEACMVFSPSQISRDDVTSTHGDQIYSAIWSGNVHSKTGDMPCKWTYWDKTLQLNQFRNLTEIPAAVSDRSGLMVIYVPKNVSLASIKETLLAMPAGLKINLDGEDRIYQEIHPTQCFTRTKDGEFQKHQTRQACIKGQYVSTDVLVPINQNTLEDIGNMFEGFAPVRKF